MTQPLWPIGLGLSLTLLLGQAAPDGARPVKPPRASEPRKDPSVRPRRSEATARPKVLRLLHIGGFRNHVAFSPDGKTLASGGGDGHVLLWDPATGRLKRDIAAHKNARSGVCQVGFSPDGRTLLSAGLAGDDTVRLWEVASGKQRACLRQEGEERTWSGVAFAAMSPDGRTVAWAGGSPRLYDLPQGKEYQKLPAEGCVDSVAFSPDGMILALAQGDATVRLWDLSRGKAIRDIPAAQSTSTGSQTVAFSPDGKWLATATGRGRSRLWDVATGKEIRRFGNASEPVFYIAFSPGGRRIAGGTYAGLRVWEAATGKEIFHLDGWSGRPRSVAFSPEGEWLAFTDNNVVVVTRIPVLAKRKDPSRPKPRPRVGKQVPLAAAQWDKHWADLADEDAAKAYRAHWKLAAASEQTPRRIARRLRPAPSATAEQKARIERLLADLESRRYEVRHAASRELEKLDELADPLLQKKLASLPSLEVFRLVNNLLARRAQREPGPRQLRDLRALEVLERIGSAEAVQVLKTLAQGAPEARLTQEAKAALGRLRDR